MPNIKFDILSFDIDLTFRFCYLDFIIKILDFYQNLDYS